MRCLSLISPTFSPNAELGSPSFSVCQLRQPKSSREVLGRPAVAMGRNAGVNASHGDVICTLDDDDAYLPHKVSTHAGSDAVLA